MVEVTLTLETYGNLSSNHGTVNRGTLEPFNETPLCADSDGGRAACG
jgi:hypothetical protein